MNAIAVIICTWNRADSLRATLASLAAQRCDQPWQVIVVDNNSSDQTAEVVRACAPLFAPDSLQYVFEGRQGKQFALNTGILASNAPLLAFTDDDILFPPDWLAQVGAAFQASDIDVGGGKTLLVWPAGIPDWYDASMHAVLGGIDLGEQPLQPAPPGYAPAGANLIARRQAFERVGMFSEAHFRHMDYEFGQRCARAGLALAYLPAIVVSAPVDAAMLSKRYFRRWYFKGGIVHENDTPSTAARFLLVPRWVVRQFVADCLRWPIDLLTAKPAARFVRELRIWRAAGTIASLWYVRLWPAKFPQWVAKYSQKRQNLY